MHPWSHTVVAVISHGRLRPFPAGSSRLSKPNRVHLSLRSIWFSTLLPTPPRGDAVTSSSRRHIGCRRPRSLTLKEDAALQRTGTFVPKRRLGTRSSFDVCSASLGLFTVHLTKSVVECPVPGIRYTLFFASVVPASKRTHGVLLVFFIPVDTNFKVEAALRGQCGKRWGKNDSIHLRKVHRKMECIIDASFVELLESNRVRLQLSTNLGNLFGLDAILCIIQL